MQARSPHGAATFREASLPQCLTRVNAMLAIAAILAAVPGLTASTAPSSHEQRPVAAWHGWCKQQQLQWQRHLRLSSSLQASGCCDSQLLGRV